MRCTPLVLLPFSAFLLGGCGELDLACPHDPHEWYDNPTYSLLKAEFTSKKASFDFNPVGKPYSRRRGSYELDQGYLHWSDACPDSHYLTEHRVEGYGTVADNGNLDLLYKEVWTDVLGNIWAELVREERSKCKGTMLRWDFDPDAYYMTRPDIDAGKSFWTTEIASDDKVTMYGEELIYELMMVIQRTYTPNFLYRETWDWGDGGYSGTRQLNTNGTRDTEWVLMGSWFGQSYDTYGLEEVYFDGSRQVDCALYDANTANEAYGFSIYYQYDGWGWGSMYLSSDGQTVSCGLTVDPTTGNCEAQCPDGIHDCSLLRC